MNPFDNARPDEAALAAAFAEIDRAVAKTREWLAVAMLLADTGLSELWAVLKAKRGSKR